MQGFEEVPLASALAAVAREPTSATLLDVREGGRRRVTQPVPMH